MGKSLFPRPRWLAAALGASLALGGGQAAAVSLMQAYEAALLNDPVFRAAIHDNAAGQEAEAIGRSGLLPNVQGNYSASRNRADQTVAGRTSHPQYISRSATVQVRQTLFNLDALARYKQGKSQSALSEAQFDLRRQELVLRVVGAYIDALFAEEQLKLARAQRDVLLEQKAVNDRLFTKGEGTRTDMLETQARLDVAEAQVLESQDNLTTTRDTLAGIIGREVDSLDQVAENFQPREVSGRQYEDWKASALRNNPEVQARELAIEVARQEFNKSRAGHAPRLDFVGTYGKNNADTVNTYDQENTVRAIGIQLTVPLYSGGYTSAVARQAAAGLEKARADKQAAVDKVLVELRKQYNLVQSSTAKVAALDKAVASGQLLVKATEQSIKGGVRINLDLLNAQQQLFTSRRDQAQARYNYLLSTLRLRAAAGTLAGEDVQEVAGYFR